MFYPQRDTEGYDLTSLPNALTLTISALRYGRDVILDSPIYTKRYGQKIIVSLPCAWRKRRIQDVRQFFAQEGTGSTGTASPDRER